MAWAEREGVRLHYDLEGAGPPMVLLHGLGTSSQLWRVGGYVDALSSRYRLVMLDLRGQGQSDRPTDVAAYTMPEHAADVVAVMDVLGIESAPLFGFSLGGSAALLAAAQHATRVDAVVVMGAVPSSSEFADVPIGDPTSTVEAAALFRDQGMSWIVDLLEKEGRPQWADLMRRSDGAANARQLEAEGLPGIATARLTDITAPVLIILGEHEKPEPMPPLPATAEVMVLPGADHAGTLEATDVVVPAVLRFFGRSRSDVSDSR